LLSAYLAFTTLLVLTPGAATAVVVRNAIEGGRSRGMAAAVGAFAGNVSYAAATGLGLASVVSHESTAFAVLQFGGAFYLGWLGLRGLWRAWRGTTGRELFATGDPSRQLESSSTRSGFGQGLLVNLLNPSVATFYLVAVPSFLPGQAINSLRYVGYASIHVTMAFAYHSSWVLGFDTFRRTWATPRGRRILETLTGIALIALALKIAL
jgi:threonine/homoserine/homoserine lactone efflux protein